MVRMSSVWDRATEFIGDNLSSILPFALVMVIAAVAQELITLSIASAPAATLLAGRGINLLIAVGSLFARLAIVALALDDRRTGGAAMAVAASRLLAMIGVMILLGVAFTLLLLPIAIVPIMAGVNPMLIQALGTVPMGLLPSGVKTFIGIYCLVLVVLVFWVVARLALLQPAIVAERRAIGAIGRSFTLTRGLTLRIIGVFVLLGGVGVVAVLATRAVFGTVLRLAFGGVGVFTVATVVTAFVVAIVAIVFTVLSDAFVSKLYLAVTAPSVDDARA